MNQIDIINNQLLTLGSLLKENDYNGFKFHDSFRQSDRDSYQFRFLGSGENVDKYFILEISHHTIANMKFEDVYSYIDSQIRNHPDLKKASHHQEFYKKFDGIINE